MIYYDLSIPVRCLIILGFFISLCVGGCLLPYIFRRKGLSQKFIVSLVMVISGTMMVIYTAQARAKLRMLEVPDISEWLCSRSVFGPLLLLLVLMTVNVYFVIDERAFRKSTITRSSIKEGVDKLSSGLCFYKNDGRVVLINRRMNELSFEIGGREVRDACAFWEMLNSGETKPGVERLSFGSRPSFRLADGSVWTFAYEKLDDIHQISAADTTQIQAVMDELKAKNIELTALNLRLKKHGENVDELTRSKERLETKARIHSDLGQALLSTRRFLLDEDSVQPVPLEIWQHNIAMLRKEAAMQEREQPMEMLSRIAESIGIAIEYKGEITQNEDVQKLFVQAASEAITNAIGHAGAKTLYIELGEDEYFHTACFRNDGHNPCEEITEGGGLGSLRKKIELAGGSMSVSIDPEFVLCVKIPKERGNIL